MASTIMYTYKMSIASIGETKSCVLAAFKLKSSNLVVIFPVSQRLNAFDTYLQERLTFVPWMPWRPAATAAAAAAAALAPLCCSQPWWFQTSPPLSPQLRFVADIHILFVSMTIWFYCHTKSVLCISALTISRHRHHQSCKHKRLCFFFT